MTQGTAKDREQPRFLAMLREDRHNQQAWEDFYHFYRRHVVTALYFLGVRDDLGDIVSEVFFRFLLYSPWRNDTSTLPDDGVIRAYLRRVARNLAIAAIGKRDREVALSIDVASKVEADERVIVEDILRQLSERDHEFFHRYYDSGYSLGELARQYGTSYAAAGTRLHRIRQKLKAAVDGDVKKVRSPKY
ncbi:MAG: sigma-70 family RNA polymerase sigma factor [Acidobacteriota bacterium]